MSMRSLAADLSLIILRNFLDLLPCIPTDKLIILAANAASTGVLDRVVEYLLAWPPRLREAKEELVNILVDFWKEAAADIGEGCFIKGLELLGIPLIKVKLAVDAIRWSGGILWDYYVINKGQDAEVKLAYTPAATQVIVFQPTGVTGQEMSGSCWDLSIASPRTGAWRCTSDHYIYDPCFSPKSETGYVICGASPLGDTRGFRLNLTQPLPRITPPSQGSSALALKLEDGTTCQFLTTGTAFMVQGQVYNYGCSDGWVILGELQPGWVWTATKARLSSDRSTIEKTVQVKIKTVWK